MCNLSILSYLVAFIAPTLASPNILQASLQTNISLPLFSALEELARIVDISYCVGTTGIVKPFLCASRCTDFPAFELVDAFNTGPLMSDSCGYVALDHGKNRVIVAFRGTYSLANTIVDLSTVPQEYVPYPGDKEDSEGGETESASKCSNCTVHMGFWTSWQNTRPLVVPHLEKVRAKHPDYDVHLVGHSLGGAVAALAGLEMESLGWAPTITTFGEPMVGNAGLRDFIDGVFELGERKGEDRRYRRVTHVEDPVPLLPLTEWGFRAHAGEIYIKKYDLQPGLKDIRLCYGDDDPKCLDRDRLALPYLEAGDGSQVDMQTIMAEIDAADSEQEAMRKIQKRWEFPLPTRLKLWQLLFAHRDYFWRLGLCVPGGDPLDWRRPHYDLPGEPGRAEDEL